MHQGKPSVLVTGMVIFFFIHAEAEYFEKDIMGNALTVTLNGPT